MLKNADTRKSVFEIDDFRSRQRPHKTAEACWIELRDARGKLQGKWDPTGDLLEIQQRGVKSRYRLIRGQKTISRSTLV